MHIELQLVVGSDQLQQIRVFFVLNLLHLLIDHYKTIHIKTSVTSEHPINIRLAVI